MVQRTELYNKELSGPKYQCVGGEKLWVYTDTQECNQRFDLLTGGRKFCPKEKAFQLDDCGFHHKLLWTLVTLKYCRLNGTFFFVYFHQNYSEIFFSVILLDIPEQLCEVYRTDTIFLWNLKLTVVMFCVLLSLFPLSLYC